VEATDTAVGARPDHFERRFARLSNERLNRKSLISMPGSAAASARPRCRI
jgi:hypothetical protein